MHERLGDPLPERGHLRLIRSRTRWVLLVGAATAAGVLLVGEGALAAVPAAAGLLARPDLRLRRRDRARTAAFRRSFPGFVSSCVILLEAGYSMERALRRSAGLGAPDPVKEMVADAFGEIDRGIPREEAFRRLVRRCREPHMSRLVFLASQGIRMGEEQVAQSLLLLAQSCWQERMDRLRREAERASAKMVFPMMLIFLAISILAMAPGLIALFSGV